MTSERDRLRERRDLVARDLEELAAQVDEGEVDPETASRLEEDYRSELASIDAALSKLPEERKASPAAPVHRPPRARGPERARSTRRVVVGGVILVAALTAAIAFAARDTTPEPTVSASPGALTVDPATVSNEELEAVVAANPGITAMRMALADRYFEAEEYSAALDHYLTIAETTTVPEEESKALARIGWMAYITDQPEAAAQYMEVALEADPNNAEAILYRGFITMYGLGDPEAAIPQLEQALGLPNISDNVVSQIEQALDEARGGGTTP
jgi:tetratricopeptide (TPR) repeat protein